VVADNGERILLTFYSEAGAVAAVELGPVCAVALAGRLLEAASARLTSKPGLRHSEGESIIALS